jgi:outer membrane protein assembly factor BamB
MCPNCGAPLGIPLDHERYFTCSYCGSVLEDEAEDPGSSVEDITLTIADRATYDFSDLAAYTGPAVRAARTGIRIVAVVVLASILLPIGVAVFAISRVARDSGGPGGGGGGGGGLDVYNFSSGKVLDSDDETGPDLVTAARSEEGNRLLYVDFDAGEPLRWDVPVDRDDLGVFDQYLTTPSLILLGAGDEVLAYNRRQGSLAWRAELPDAIQHNICPGCFQLLGEGRTFMTLSADGTLAAWSAADGTQQWARRMSATPRQVVSFGGNPAVIDTEAGVTTVHVLGLADGSPVATLPVGCPGGFGNSRRQEIGIYDHLVPVAPASFVWVSDDCAQRWDPGPGAAAWETPLPDGFSSPDDAEHFAVSNTAVHAADGATVQSFDLASGALRTVTRPDTDLVPIGAQDGVLVLEATTTRGTRKATIEAVDLATGNLKWTFEPAADAQLQPSSFLFVTSDAWLATLTPAGLSVVQYQEEDKKLLFQMIPLASGTASSPSTFDLAGHGFVDAPSFFGYRNGNLVMAAHTDIVVVDPATAEVTQEGP